MHRVLVIGVSAVALADGLLRTALAIQMDAAGFNLATAGVVMSSYWLGYVLGGLTGKKLIHGVGRIRAFAGSAGLVTVAVLATSLHVDPILWGLFRVATGFGCAILFVAAESWLNGIATAETRGSIFASYMVTTYSALGAGQLLLIFVPPSDSRIFAVVAISFSISLVPLALSQVTAPALGQLSQFGLRGLAEIAPLAAMTCALSGVASAAFYALGPTFLSSRGFSFAELSLSLTSAVFGGLLSQWPLGRLSNLIDRRLVLLLTAIGAATTALILGGPARFWSLFGLSGMAALHIGFLAALYPIAVAQANDRVRSEDVIAASGALIIVNGAGSAFGPILAGLAMQGLGPSALFFVIAAACMPIIVMCVFSLRLSTAKTLEAKRFVPLNASTALGILHPQIEHVTGPADVPPAR